MSVPREEPMLEVPTPIQPAIELFCLFSRFEYALKRAGYLKPARNGARAEPDWKRFSNEADKLGLFERFRNDPDIKFLIDHPPWREVVRDGRPDWEVEPGPECMVSLIEAVKRVRNNLFHGGKTPYERDHGSERDEPLLRGAVAALRALLDAHSDIRKAFRLD